MNTLPLAHSSALIAEGFHALGSVPTPECTTHYFVDPVRCQIAWISETRGPAKVRAYDACPLEILSVATLCLEQQTQNRAEAVRVAQLQLALWGLPLSVDACLTHSVKVQTGHAPTQID